MPKTIAHKRGMNPARLLIIIVLYIILAFCFLVLYDRNSYLQYSRSLWGFLIVGAACICLYFHGGSSPRGFYLFGPIYLCWIFIASLAKGHTTFSNDLYQITFVEQCVVFCIAFPFCCFVKDPDRRLLNRFLLIFLSIMACLIWLCLIGTFTGKKISLFHKLAFGASYTSTGRLKLRVLNLHYYHLGYISVICFFITIYLAVSRPKARWFPLWIVFLITFASAVLMTYSRNAVLALFFGLLMALYIFLQKVCSRKGLRGMIFWSAAIVGGVLIVVGMNLIYQAVHSIRDIWYGLSGLSSRTAIWSGGIRALLSHPEALVIGFPLDTAMDTVNQFIPMENTVSHMHNGFMEMLVSFGLPGLILLLAFCIYVLRHCCRLFSSTRAQGISAADKALILVPVATMLMNLFDSIFPLEERIPILISVINALISGYIIEASQRCNIPTMNDAREPAVLSR